MLALQLQIARSLFDILLCDLFLFLILLLGLVFLFSFYFDFYA